eukprot:jgi/Hompol1/1316/HPOL_005557-RA
MQPTANAHHKHSGATHQIEPHTSGIVSINKQDVSSHDTHSKAKNISASSIRIIVPSSVAQLVKLYNSSQTASQRRACEITARDIIARLEFLVLASTIADAFRKDMIRSRIFPDLNHPSSTTAASFAGTVSSNTAHNPTLLGASAAAIHRRKMPPKTHTKPITTTNDLPSTSPTAPLQALSSASSVIPTH